MKRILALVLTVVMLFTVASCNLLPGADVQKPNEGINSEVTTPEETTTIQVIIPEVTTPADTFVTYTVTVVDENNAPLAGATVQLCVGDICRLPVPTNAQGVATVTADKGDYTVKVTLAGYTGEPSYSFAADSTELTVQLTKNVGGNVPEETTPDIEAPTFPEFEATLPEASKVIANIIGVVAATVEVSKDSQLVVVLKDCGPDSNGYKQVLFFEVAEANLDSDSELLKAHLKVKVGEAVIMLSEGDSADDVVVGKEDITSYYEFSIIVNGENVLLSVQDQHASQNLSNLVYGAIAQMMGVESIESLEAMFAQAQKNAYLVQQLQETVLPMVVAALGGAMQEIPTISPAYGEHIANVFATLGEDIFAATIDDVTGYTTYSINVDALKNLLSEIEGKTFAEYLEGVYGENVVEALSSFLKSLPDKKVKDIVDSAVALAEATGADIKDIYALLDMYIYSVTGIEFSIEDQINTRYNNTLIELLAELNGVSKDDAAFAGIKSLFTNAADVLETVSMDAILSSMFMGTTEGFIDALKATVDQFGEVIVYNVTVDAEGNVVAINYGVGDLQYNLVINGEDSIITVSYPNGTEIVVTTNGTICDVVVRQDGENLLSGNVIVDEIINSDEVVIYATLNDGKNDVLEYLSVSENGVITYLEVVIKGYNVVENTHYYPETDELIETREEEVVEVIVVEYWSDDDATAFDASIKMGQSTGMGHKNPEIGEFSDTWKTEYYDFFSVEYYSNDGVDLRLFFGEDLSVEASQYGNSIYASITNNGERVASVDASVKDETVGEDEIFDVIVEVRNAEDLVFDCILDSTNGVVNSFEITFRGYDEEREIYYNPETEEITVTQEKELVDVIRVEYLNNGYATIFDANVQFSQSTGMGESDPETGEEHITITTEHYEFLNARYKYIDGLADLRISLGEDWSAIHLTQSSTGMNVEVTKNGNVILTGSVSVTEETVGEDEAFNVAIDLRDSENDLLDCTVVMVNGVINALDAVIRGTYVEEEWVETPMTEEEMEKFYEDLFGIGSGTIVGDVIIKNPEEGAVTVIPGGGFVTIVPSPDGTVGDVEYGNVVGGIVLNKGEWVRTETFVEFLNLQFRSYDDKSVWTISAYESILSGAEYVTVTVCENQISVVLTQEDEVVVDAGLSVIENGIGVHWGGEDYKFTCDQIENGVKVTLFNETSEGNIVVVEIVNNEQGETVIGIDLSKLTVYGDLYESCAIAFKGAIIFKAA